MKAQDLIKRLQENPESEVQIRVKVLTEENGYKHEVFAWVPLEEKHIQKTKFGGNTLFIGQTLTNLLNVDYFPHQNAGEDFFVIFLPNK